MLSIAYCHHLQTLRRENRRFDKSRAPAKKKRGTWDWAGRESAEESRDWLGWKSQTAAVTQMKR